MSFGPPGLAEGAYSCGLASACQYLTLSNPLFFIDSGHAGAQYFIIAAALLDFPRHVRAILTNSCIAARPVPGECEYRRYAAIDLGGRCYDVALAGAGTGPRCGFCPVFRCVDGHGCILRRLQNSEFYAEI